MRKIYLNIVLLLRVFLSFRDNIDIVSVSKDGIVKVSPFYHWSDKELDEYLEMNKLPNEFTYFDPTKVDSNRECGLHN